LYKKHAVYLSVCLLVTPLVSVAAELATPVMSPLQSTLAQLPQACSQLPSSLDASAQALLVEFYAQQQFAPAWSQATRLEALLPQLEQLADDGLNPASYQLASLRSFAQQSASAAVDDCRDIFISHVYLQALQHLQRGRLQQAKVEPFWQAPESAALVSPSTAALSHLAVSGLDDLPAAFAPDVTAIPSLARRLCVFTPTAVAQLAATGQWAIVASGDDRCAGTGAGSAFV
jgi:L,D-transpeptidase YcbB